MFTDGAPDRRNIYYYTLSKVLNKYRHCKKKMSAWMVMTTLVYIVDTFILLAVINYQQTGIKTSRRDNSAQKTPQTVRQLQSVLAHNQLDGCLTSTHRP